MLYFALLPPDTRYMTQTRVTRAHTCTPVGTRDIADRLDLRPNTVAVYKTRGLLPPERWTISGLPVWCFEHDIEPELVDGRFSVRD